VTREHTYYPSVYYTRLPFYALVLKPLGSLPYFTAYWTYQAVSLAVFGVFLFLYATRIYKELIVFASLSVPLLINFANGQDAGLVTAFAGFALLLARRGRGTLAGFVFSLATIKFHLLVLVPLAILIHRKWDWLKGGIAGGAFLMALSVIADGTGWPARFLGVVSNPELHPGPEHMPTFRNVAWLLSGGDNRPLEIGLSILVAAAMAYLVARIVDFEVAFCLCLALGLVVCHHAYSQDLLLLLLPLAIFATKPGFKLLRGVTMAVALPPTAFLLFTGFPYSTGVPALLLSILVAAYADVFSSAAAHRPTGA
jgi:hypothetical protein